MPSSEIPVPGFDDLQLATSPEALHSLPSVVGKKAKKKAKKQQAKQQRVDDEEDTPYAKSITPSPPVFAVDHGTTKLIDTSPPTATIEVGKKPEWKFDFEDDDPDITELPTATHVPKVSAISSPEPLIEDFGDDTTAYEDAEPIVKPYRDASPLSTATPPSPPALLQSRNITNGPASPPLRSAVPASGTRESLARPRLGSYSRDNASRRASLLEHISPRPRHAYLEAPPPHLAQAHFFGVPDFGFNLTAEKVDQDKQAGSGGYCCAFDSFDDAGDLASAKNAKDALLVGWEGGLDIYRVLADKMEIVGRLEGLRGSVVGAKLLPITTRFDPMQTQRPMIALIIHGPMETVDDDLADGESVGATAEAQATRYQTTVEVYSLQSQKHFSTLYKSLPKSTSQPKIGQLATVPDPIGDLSLDTKGRFLVLSSGKSGEVFVFTSSVALSDEDLHFKCIGKYWTALQSRLDSSSRPTSAEAGQIGDVTDETVTTPLLDLSHRWLAIVCPSISSKISIQGTPSISTDHPPPPGINSHAPPTQPPLTAETIGINAEGAISRLTRQAAQELLKASRKGFELGWAGWREFTNPTPPARNSNQMRTDSGEAAFPPTHAPPDDPKRFAREPAVVSIIDLERLLDKDHYPKGSSSHLSTFALEDGCNFLSFSSDGLKLLTTSRRGEFSSIWDLKQAAGRGLCSKYLDDEPSGPFVERIMHIPRNSQSIVLDAIWSRDDDYLAMLTAHGTIHLHEVAKYAKVTSKARRRSTVTLPNHENKSDATVSLSQGMSPPSSNGLLGSIKSSWQTVSTQVNAIRSTAPTAQAFGLPTSFAGFKDTANAASAAGGRVVARGLSHGYSAAKTGMGDMWHADDNKIRHKELSDATIQASIRWVKRKGGPTLLVACGGKVFAHPVQRVTRQRGDLAVTALKAEKGGRREFGLPPISTTSTTTPCAGQGPHGFWSLRLPQSTEPARKRRSTPFGQQTHEVETNPPYCPFHIDTRVSMLVFDGALPNGSGAFDHATNSMADLDSFRTQGFGANASDEPWCFGDSLPPSIKINDRTTMSDIDGNSDEGDEGVDDMLQGVMESKTIVHPTGLRINTRRKPGRRRNVDGPHMTADGEFELLEDDEDQFM